MSRDESFFDLSAGEDVSDWGGKSTRGKPAPKSGTSTPQNRQPAQTSPSLPPAGTSRPGTQSPSTTTGQGIPTARQTQPAPAAPVARKTAPAQPAPRQTPQTPSTSQQRTPSNPVRPPVAAPKQAPPSVPALPTTGTGVPSGSGLPTVPPQSPLRQPAASPTVPPASPAPAEEHHTPYQSAPPAYVPPAYTPPATQQTPAYEPEQYAPSTPPQAPPAAPSEYVDGRPNDWNFSPPAVQQSAPATPEGEDDDFIQETPPARRSGNSNQKSSKGKGKNSGKNGSKKSKNRDDKPDMGGKTKANVIRWTALGLIGILCALGVKATFFPQQFPGPEQVVNVVQQGLGVSDFPADRAEAFVIAFTRAYLTVDNSGSSGRNQELAKYVPAGILDQIKGSLGNTPQTISEGPYVSGIRYDVDSDEDAVFTVASRLNNGYWVYLEIPVYYNSATSAFAVSGAPALVSEPALATVPEQEAPWVVDEEVNARVENFLQEFFKTWGASTEESPAVLVDTYATKDANPRVTNGIEGVTFDSITNLTISEPLEASGNTESRIARVTVRWNVAPATVAPSPEDEFVSDGDEIRPTQYNMTYEVMLVNYTNIEENSWRIRNIRGGVREIVGGQGEVTEEIVEEAG